MHGAFVSYVEMVFTITHKVGSGTYNCNVPALAIAGATAGAVIMRYAGPYIIRYVYKLLVSWITCMQCHCTDSCCERQANDPCARPFPQIQGERGTSIGEEQGELVGMQVVCPKESHADYSNCTYLAVVDSQQNTIRPLAAVSRSLWALAVHDGKIAVASALAGLTSYWTRFLTVMEGCWHKVNRV